MIWEDVPLPVDPVERIRALRILLEVYRRARAPRVARTFRRAARRVYGPYLVAVFPRTPDRPDPRVLYLGKPGSEGARFAEWLSGMSDGSAFRLARLAVRQLGAAFRELRRAPERLDVTVAVLAETFGFEPGKEDPDPPPGPAEVVLGPWRAGFSRVLRSLL